MLTALNDRKPVGNETLGIVDSFIIDTIVGNTLYSSDGVSMTLSDIGAAKLRPEVGSRYYLFSGGLIGILSADDIDAERTLNEKARYIRAHVAARRSAIESKYWIRVIQEGDLHHWLPAYPLSVLQMS
ncbi:hypothetical protein pEaSNUABM54_00136 [Erwinia phage pEa_SNUABM_54]|nr:hypothetical protein pEaSNUABM54_00136 [Erwinia phage pEa_SNUABM_54]